MSSALNFPNRHERNLISINYIATFSIVFLVTDVTQGLIISTNFYVTSFGASIGLCCVAPLYFLFVMRLFLKKYSIQKFIPSNFSSPVSKDFVLVPSLLNLFPLHFFSSFPASSDPVHIRQIFLKQTIGIVVKL